MKGFRWLGRGAKAVGKAVAYPVTKPVSALARKAGQEAAAGALDQVHTRVAEVLEPPPTYTPREGRPTGWKDVAKVALQLLLEKLRAKWARRR